MIFKCYVNLCLMTRFRGFLGFFLLSQHLHHRSISDLDENKEKAHPRILKKIGSLGERKFHPVIQPGGLERRNKKRNHQPGGERNFTATLESTKPSILREN